MSVLVNEKTRVVVQGLTGREGSFHAGQMIEYGTTGRRWRHARKGRHEARERADVQHGFGCGS